MAGWTGFEPARRSLAHRFPTGSLGPLGHQPISENATLTRRRWRTQHLLSFFGAGHRIRTCVGFPRLLTKQLPLATWLIRRKWCCGRGSNPRSPPYQGGALPLGHRSMREGSGAATTNRTRDLLITRQLLCQLSYDGKTGIPSGVRTRVSAVRGRRPGPLVDGDGNWSGRWDLNPRHSAWEADALPLNYARTEELGRSNLNTVFRLRVKIFYPFTHMTCLRVLRTLTRSFWFSITWSMSL